MDIGVKPVKCCSPIFIVSGKGLCTAGSSVFIYPSPLSLPPPLTWHSSGRWWVRPWSWRSAGIPQTTGPHDGTPPARPDLSTGTLTGASSRTLLSAVPATTDNYREVQGQVDGGGEKFIVLALNFASSMLVTFRWLRWVTIAFSLPAKPVSERVKIAILLSVAALLKIILLWSVQFPRKIGKLWGFITIYRIIWPFLLRDLHENWLLYLHTLVEYENGGNLTMKCPRALCFLSGTVSL